MRATCQVHKPVCPRVLTRWLQWLHDPVKRPAREYVIPGGKCPVEAVEDGSAE